LIHSNWIARDVVSNSPTVFLYEAATTIGAKLVRNILRRGASSARNRTPSDMRVQYDNARAKIELTNFDDYVFGAERDDFILSNDKIVVGSPRIGVKHYLPLLQDLLMRRAGTGPVIELGCGSGRNLLYLKKSGTQNELIGFELSPVSVDLANRAAKKFNLDINFATADVTKTIPFNGDVAAVFSVHAFEMMPRIFPDALDRIVQLRPGLAIFLEPIETLWPLNLRGLVSRLRVRQLDRLRHFMAYVEPRFKVLEKRPLPFASNPLNQTCLVVATPRGTTA
jgi:SAM-dependent methyltransferase